MKKSRKLIEPARDFVADGALGALRKPASSGRSQAEILRNYRERRKRMLEQGLEPAKGKNRRRLGRPPNRPQDEDAIGILGLFEGQSSGWYPMVFLPRELKRWRENKGPAGKKKCQRCRRYVDLVIKDSEGFRSCENCILKRKVEEAVGDVKFPGRQKTALERLLDSEDGKSD